MSKKIVCLMIMSLAFGCSSSQTVRSTVKMGSMFTPRNFPHSNGDDVNNYFELSKEMGNHISLLLQWSGASDLTFTRQLQNGAKIHGLKFHVTLSPIRVHPQRDRVSPPPGMTGTRISFGDKSIRAAFKAKALELAAIRPDILGIGSEANLLATNKSEFIHYVSLTKEVYSAIKAKYPDQVVAISFQYDVEKLKLKPHYVPGAIAAFKNSLDVYAFTSYPMVFSRTISDDYYDVMKRYDRVSIEEIGVSSDQIGESQQAQFYGRLGTLLPDVEYITLFKMHDFTAGGEDKFESIGIRRNDGAPKFSWGTVKNLK